MFEAVSEGGFLCLLPFVVNVFCLVHCVSRVLCPPGIGLNVSVSPGVVCFYSMQHFVCSINFKIFLNERVTR